MHQSPILRSQKIVPSQRSPKPPPAFCPQCLSCALNVLNEFLSARVSPSAIDFSQFGPTLQTVVTGIDAILLAGLGSRATRATQPKTLGSPRRLSRRSANLPARSLTDSRDPLEQKRLNVSKRDPFLLHRVSFPHCDGTLVYWPVLADRIEIDGHAKGSTGLILASITPPDGT